MTAKWHALAAFLLAVGLCASVARPAADDKQDVKKRDEANAPNPVIELSTTAYKTAEFGRTNKSPEALVAAALMLRSLQTAKLEPIAEKPTDEDGKPLEDRSVAAESFDDQATRLFAEASLMAAWLGLKGFDKYIESAKSRPTRGIVGGRAKLINRQLSPAGQRGSAEVFSFQFENRKPCEIAVNASIPVQLVVQQKLNGIFWANGMTQIGAIQGIPLGRPRETTTVVVILRNLDPERVVTYQLLVR